MLGRDLASAELVGRWPLTRLEVVLAEAVSRGPVPGFDVRVLAVAGAAGGVWRMHAAAARLGDQPWAARVWPEWVWEGPRFGEFDVLAPGVAGAWGDRVRGGAV